MSLQTLAPPRDITWSRMCFSPDMVDTRVNDFAFSPKWRSSLAVYYYIVPEEETVDAYPNSRIVYLKLTASITGWNPSESLRNQMTLAREAGTWGDLERSMWEAVASSGWAQKYWPCLGAIAQVAIYPSAQDEISLDDYPYFVDFEPKKRELIESVTEGSEVLSGTAGKTSVTKGTTSVVSTEISAKAKGSYGPVSAEASATHSWSDTTVNQNTTDTSREARETLSKTTSTSQMYQLFNGYHLGTNRALFVIAPRPHTVSSAQQTEFALIDGERKLEGVQEVFLVVHMPRSLKGFCVQAGLDTGHRAPEPVAYQAIARGAVSTPGATTTTPTPDDTTTPAPETPVDLLVVTRRKVQSCGVFDENGEFQLTPVLEPPRDLIVGEFGLPRNPGVMARTSGGDEARRRRIDAADAFNQAQSRINRLMLDNASAGAYAPRPFLESAVFGALASREATTIDMPLSELVQRGALSAIEVRELARNRITTVGELFRHAVRPRDSNIVRDARTRLLKGLTRTGRAPG